MRVELEAIREKHDQLSDEKFKVEEIVDKAHQEADLELDIAKYILRTHVLLQDAFTQRLLFFSQPIAALPIIFEHKDLQHAEELTDDRERSAHFVSDHLQDHLLLLQLFLEFLRLVVDKCSLEPDEEALEAFEVD